MYFLCGVQEISCCKNNTVFLENKRDEVPFIYRSNRSQVFLKIVVIKTFPYFTGNHLCGSHFIRMKIQHRCFPVKFEKFLRTPFLTEHLWWLFLCYSQLLVFDIKSQVFNSSDEFYSRLTVPLRRIKIYYQCSWNHDEPGSTTIKNFKITGWVWVRHFQKKPSEAFYQKKCSQKFCKIHKKTPVPGSLF